MIIYEVNLFIDESIFEAFKHWLKEEHIPEILALPQIFQRAQVYTLETEPKSLVVQYHVQAREDLEKYFQEYAPKMREKGVEKFGDKFTATRRILFPDYS